jgi:anti-anti-sigma factor
MATNPVPASELGLTTERGPTEIIVHCTGKITSNTIQALKATVKPLFSESKSIVLDLTSVNFLDSSGLGAIEAYQFEPAPEGTLQYYEVGPIFG